MKAIKFPFQFDSFGKVISTSDSDTIYRERILTLVSTVVLNRPMRPTYGTDVPRAIYENGGDANNSVPIAINRAIATFLPAVKVAAIDIVGPNETGAMSIDILVELPSGTQASITTPYSVFSSSGVSLGEIV
jgi:phage baseplate assembly protein W